MVIDMKINLAFIGWSLLFMAALLLIPASIWYLSEFIHNLICGSYDIFCYVPLSIFSAALIIWFSLIIYLNTNHCA